MKITIYCDIFTCWNSWGFCRSSWGLLAMTWPNFLLLIPSSANCFTITFNLSIEQPKRSGQLLIARSTLDFGTYKHKIYICIQLFWITKDSTKYEAYANHEHPSTRVEYEICISKLLYVVNIYSFSCLWFILFKTVAKHLCRCTRTLAQSHTYACLRLYVFSIFLCIIFTYIHR